MFRHVKCHIRIKGNPGALSSEVPFNFRLYPGIGRTRVEHRLKHCLFIQKTPMSTHTSILYHICHCLDQVKYHGSMLVVSSSKLKSEPKTNAVDVIQHVCYFYFAERL